MHEKRPGNIASKTDDAESSFSMHGEISTYQEFCMDLISNQTPNFLELLHDVNLFKEFTLLGIECCRMSNPFTLFSCWDWPSAIQFLDGSYWSLHTSAINFFLQRVTTLCNVRLKHQQPSFVLVSPLICASLESQLPSHTLAITDSLSQTVPTSDQC